MVFGYVGIVQKVKIYTKSARHLKNSINTRRLYGTGCSAWVMPQCLSRVYIHSIPFHSKVGLEHGYGVSDMLDIQIRGLPGSSAHYPGHSVPQNGPVPSREPLKRYPMFEVEGFIQSRLLGLGRSWSVTSGPQTTAGKILAQI